MKKRLQDDRSPAPAQEAGETISGLIESVVFHSEDSGYSVCRLKVAGREELVTVVGSCSTPWVGETMKASGQWTRHAKHGLQLQASSMICYPPNSPKAIEKYLASGMIRGVGKVTAERLVAKFGADTLRIIERESQRLQEVPGLGPHRRKLIKESWNEQMGVRDLMLFLRGHGIGTAQAFRIRRQYGEHAVTLIRENPYRLCDDVWGIGFKTADSVALSLGVPKDSEIRARAGLSYLLHFMSDEGHCFAPRDELVEYTASQLDIPEPTVKTALSNLLASGVLIAEDWNIYLAPMYRAEKGTAENLARLLSTKASFPPIISENALPWAEKKMRLHFDEIQAQALHTSLRNKVSIITGGPGVGKTTIIRALVDVFSARQLVVQLAAPTGRAAKRMEEATHHKAATIHRLLKFNPRLMRFEHNQDKRLEGHVFIIDEVSMIDIYLMHSFTSALPDNAVLVMVGDVDQLPSVGPGNVLRDMIASRVIPCTCLQTIFRQETGGLIVQNAHRVNHGEPPIGAEASDEMTDFYFFEAKEPEEVIKKMLDLVTRHIPRQFEFDPMSDIQVLTPMRKNQLGADNLNLVLQEALNPTGKSATRFGRHYRIRDRVMQIRNNYDKDVYNGDIGRVRDVDETNQKLVVDFDGRLVDYDFTELDELVLAYACSIHKSQGSEYPAVVLLVATQHFKLLQRNLLYTAITRGRKLVCLVGSKKAVYIAVSNNEIRLRRTALRAALEANIYGK
jgi:exodeoxyribonuclease V alpha subunit